LLHSQICISFLFSFMSELDERINQLQQRLDNLFKSQENFQKEIANIRFELKSLRAFSEQPKSEVKYEPERKPPVREYVPPKQTYQSASERETKFGEQQIFTTPDNESRIKIKSDLEKFIGENLISKIGIVILVLGVAIGAKYAIDRDLISPLTRIVLGYLFGFGLLAIAIRLKEKYLNFSAVLLSGAMAIQYFITYAAHSFYGLIAQSSAFALMLIFTIFTVLTAIKYNRQIIAHFGLVGAYTIPFLLSDNSGNYGFLFSYISIINLGILAISIKKYWKSLFYSSFLITWATFAGWFLFKYNSLDYFHLALTFLTVFFFIFYTTFISYKILSKENFTSEIVFLVLANSFIFYGFGYAIIGSRAGGEYFLGLFTAANAFVHFIVAWTISKLNLADRTVVYLISALVLTFISITIPVQFHSNWITLLWAAEAAILFSIGRMKGIPLYEHFSYPLMILAAVSLLNDWQIAAYKQNFSITNQNAQIPIFNADFLTSVLFVAAFVFVYFVHQNKKYAPAVSKDLYRIFPVALPAVLLFALYNAFRVEIGNYYYYKLASNGIIRDSAGNSISSLGRDLSSFNFIWQTNYTILFLSVLSFVNIKKIKSSILGVVNLVLNALVLLFFLIGGFLVLGDLRETFLQPNNASLFAPDVFHILARYISLAFVTALILVSYKYINQDFLEERFPNLPFNRAFDFVFYFSLLVIVSSELINLMDIFGYRESYKLGLSILWGSYALFLIVLGINRGKKHLRIGAIILFALTLMKLFLYDISGLDTISKTVVFVSLGILLLIISFLYNKYKHLIFD